MSQLPTVAIDGRFAIRLTDLLDRLERFTVSSVTEEDWIISQAMTGT
jgi:hypothetical protein